MAELTEEQVQELQQKVADAEKELAELRPLKDSSGKAKQEFADKEKAWQEEKKLLEDSANPNWPKARRQIDALKKVAEEKGVKVDEEGNIVSNPNQVNIEQIRQEAVNAARNELLGGRVEEILDEYDPESKEVVRHYYNKITAGEVVTLKNIAGFINQAEATARAGSGKEIKKSAFGYSGGQGPRLRSETEGKLDDSTAKDIGKKLNLPFATAENKK